MHEAWFYCPDLRCGEIVLDESEARHALQSRRLSRGDALTLFDGCGHVARATIVSGGCATRPSVDVKARRASRRPTTTVLAGEIADVPRPRRTLTLIVPGCKGARLDWLVEKCTELGVTRLVFAEFERSVVHVGPQQADKLRRTTLEACKQCRRAWLPEIETSLAVADTAVAGANAALLVAHLEENAPSLISWLAQNITSVRHLAVVIGPEGGLAPQELASLQHGNAQVVRLAEHVLRVETAALAVAAAWNGHALDVT